MLVIGSRALAIRCRRALLREPADFDFVCSRDEVNRFDFSKLGKLKKDPYEVDGGTKLIAEGDSICEFEYAVPGTSNEKLLELAEPEAIKTSIGDVPSLDLLFAIKTSHRHKKNSPFFWKNLADWHSMKRCGAKVRDEHKPFLKQREAETYASQKHPSLMRDKKNFFSEEELIEYVHDHDSIHESVALHGEPAYRKFATDGHEVYSSKQKFAQCSREIQIASVLEESAVLAIERSLVPHPGVLTEEQAWKLAFSKVCTSIASGWWRSFAYENALDCLRIWPKDYNERFKRGLENGLVKPFVKAGM